MAAQFSGTSSGGNATIDDALKQALMAAQKEMNTNHFSWMLHKINGDYGGFVGKNIVVEIEVI